MLRNPTSPGKSESGRLRTRGNGIMLDGSRNHMNSPDGDPARPTTPPAATRRGIWWMVAAVLGGVVVLTLILTTRHQPPPSAQPPAAAASSPPNPASASSPPASLPDFAVDAVSVLEGDANWYDVPENSLPQRRAWPGEFTAASNRVPPNTYVRVRRTDSKADPQKSIVVRITDDGVHRKNTVIDLDRAAAEALDMVKAGQVRVRVEVLALKNASTDKPVAKKDATPAAPRASEITDKPVASEQQEKDAANAKTDGHSAP